MDLDKILKGISFRLVKTSEEEDAVKRIRYESYLEAGYIKENDERRYSDGFDDLEFTSKYLAFDNGNPFGTMRLVMDSKEFGLPVDKESFSESIKFLRDENRKLAEPSKLAFLPEYQNGIGNFNFYMQKIMFLDAKRKGVDDLVIAVIPRHARFYEHFLFFERISDEKKYGTLGGIPAVCLRLDLTTFKEKMEERYKGQPFDLYHHFFIEESKNIIL